MNPRRDLIVNIYLRALWDHTVSPKTFSQEVLICGSLGHLVVRGGDRFLFKSKEQTEQKEETLYVDVQDLYFAASEALMSRLYIKGLCKMVGATKESKDRIGLNKLEALVFKMVFMCAPEAIRKSSETQSCYAILQVTNINYVVLNVLPKASQKDLKR
ncbi:hypothetical protein GQX74_013958 [Glossina fuscipes]|nr:hypothetical protein GQX74_013958 [Glossina fuscipes]